MLSSWTYQQKCNWMTGRIRSYTSLSSTVPAFGWQSTVCITIICINTGWHMQIYEAENLPKCSTLWLISCQTISMRGYLSVSGLPWSHLHLPAAQYNHTLTYCMTTEYGGLTGEVGDMGLAQEHHSIVYSATLVPRRFYPHSLATKITTFCSQAPFPHPEAPTVSSK